MWKNIDPFYVILFVVVIGMLIYRWSNRTPDISGQVAPTFTGTTLAGKKLDFKDFKGQYVLVDFWASWCGPCRGANPRVVKLYEKYHDKGFAVIGIGLERNAEDWKKAIEKDGLIWPSQILDNTNTGQSISDSYGVKTIPSKFLVDPKGAIIASNPSFGTIDRILSENLIKK